MKHLLQRMWREEAGQDLTEYALLLVLIALAVAVILPTFANALITAFTNAADNLTDATTAAP